VVGRAERWRDAEVRRGLWSVERWETEEERARTANA
jgi:hypothetical protein